MTPNPVIPAVAPITLGDTIPLGRLHTVALVVGGALLIAAAAQFRPSLAFTPVPITGQRFGYFVGFVIAAAAVGYVAERRQDRQFATSWTAMLAGTVLIYAARCGWLAHSLGVPFYSGDGKDAFSYGLTPFITGDMLKLTLGAALTPVAWRFVERGSRD